MGALQEGPVHSSAEAFRISSFEEKCLGTHEMSPCPCVFQIGRTQPRGDRAGSGLETRSNPRSYKGLPGSRRSGQERLEAERVKAAAMIVEAVDPKVPRE